MFKKTTELRKKLNILRESTSIRGYCNIVKEYMYNVMQIDTTTNRIYKVVGGHLKDAEIEKALWIYINDAFQSLHENQQQINTLKADIQNRFTNC